MTTEYELDLDGAEKTRSLIVARLRASGELDGDIVEALSGPGVPDWFLSHPFQVVAGLEELSGTDTDLQVPEKWRDSLPSLISMSDARQLLVLYRRALTDGTREDQRALLSQTYLVEHWPDVAREVHPVIVSVWEQRFSGLRR